MKAQKTIIRATYKNEKCEDNGKIYIWTAYKCKSTGYWMLIDYAKYERCLEKTWNDSTGVINRILANHNMSAKVS